MEQTSVEKDDQDSPWKEALDQFFQPFLELVFPAVAEAIDWNQPVKSLNTELQQLTPESSSGRLYADKLVEVTLLSGDQEWLLVHIEVQGRAQKNFNQRMFHYHVRIWDKYQQPLLSLAVLTDIQDSFRPGLYQNNLNHLGQNLTFEFPTIKLLDWMGRIDELEDNLNPFALVLLAQLQVMRYGKDQAQQRLEAKKHLTRTLFRRGYSKDRIAELLRLIEWMITLPEALEADYSKQVKLLKEEPQMAFVSTLERLAKDEGIAEERQRAEAEKQRLAVEKQRAEAEKQQFETGIITLLKQGVLTEEQVAQAINLSIEQVRELKARL